jgi:hypothetical protein
MRGVYGHVSPAMREDLKAALQALREDSLRQRARLAAGSALPLLGRLLAWRTARQKSRPLPFGSQKSDTGRGGTRTAGHRMLCDL